MRQQVRLLRDTILPSFWENLWQQRHPILDTIILGIVGALTAQLFLLMLRVANEWFLTGIAGYRPPGLLREGGVLSQTIGPHGLWLIPVVTTLGGLISGILVYSLAPEAEGHGTDTVVKAFHRQAGFIRARVSPLKMIASAITIGTGGSAGREGPIALITAGIGSIYGTLTHRSDEERRLTVLIGMAAGLSAIFRSPIGTAIFAIEVPYSRMEYESVALLYTMLASIIAYAVNGLFVGYGPLFFVPPGLPTPGFFDFQWYILLGIIAGLIATLLPLLFYGIRDLFHSLPIPPHVKPAIGGLLIGLMALELPQVLGGGYGWIQEAIDGRLADNLLLVLVFAKILAFAFTVSSGGSGGVFAPSLYVGAMLGGFLAHLFNQPSAPFVIVAMGAVFGGAARVPVATLLMVTEMTGGYELLVPAALAIMVSFLIQRALSSRLKYKSLYEMQVPGRPDSPAHALDYYEALLHLLSEKTFTVPATVSHMNLRSLVESGVPVDLPGDKQMVIGTLKPGSAYIGKLLQTDFAIENQGEVEIVAAFRRGRTLLPRSNTRLREGDQLLVITTRRANEQLAKNVALDSPLSASSTDGSHGVAGVSR
jgi:chloride channel protein, CIC family